MLDCSKKRHIIKLKRQMKGKIINSTYHIRRKSKVFF